MGHQQSNTPIKNCEFSFDDAARFPTGHGDSVQPHHLCGFPGKQLGFLDGCFESFGVFGFSLVDVVGFSPFGLTTLSTAVGGGCALGF